MTRWDDPLFRCFVHVAEQMSFSGAAAALGLTQPAVTVRIKRLEHELGYPLFSRTTREVALTRRGALLFQQVKAAIRVTDECLRVADELRTEGGGELKIGSTAFGSEFRSLAVERFRRLHPQVTLEIEIGSTKQILERLDAGEFDLGFGARTDDDDRFDQITVLSVPIGFLIPRNARIADSPTLSLDRLRKLGVSVPKASAHPELYRVLHEFLAKLKISETILPYGTSEDLIEHGRRSGSVIATARPRAIPEDLVFRQVTQLEYEMNFGFARRRDDDRTVVGKFWDVILQTVRGDSHGE